MAFHTSAALFSQNTEAVQTVVVGNETNINDLVGQVHCLCQQVDELQRCITGGRTAEAGPAIDERSAGSTQAAERSALNAAKQGLAIRRRRERVFGAGLFSEPVWDILLELYIARAEGCDVPVGNACLAASVPMTSALRWCQLLQDRKIVYRERDPNDGRRVFLRMSDATFAKLTTLLANFTPARDAEVVPVTERIPADCYEFESQPQLAAFRF